MSTGGQALGGLVGGIAGFLLGGGPTGALYGAQLGMMVGGYLDPPKGPTVNGPRLDDLSVQTSTYGSVIPRVYGTVTVNGNVLWLENNSIKETVTKKKSGGKGGGSKTTTRTYTYSATFAVGLCQGPIVGVRRIWVGPDLLYDAGSSDIDTIMASNATAAGFVIYPGTDTQLPDPRMQATLGVDNTPAWRGLAYIVFNDLQLARYGNSLMGAQVRVELIKAGSIADYPTTIHAASIPIKQWSRPAWNGAVFCSIDLTQTKSDKTCLVSSDGVTWVSYALPSVAPDPSDWRYVGANERTGTLIAVRFWNPENRCARSVDNGKTWSWVSLPVSGQTAGVTCGNGIWVISSTYNGRMLFSTNDGLGWTSVTFPHATTDYRSEVYWSPTFSQFYVAYYTGSGVNNHIASSPDGSYWSSVAIYASPNWEFLSEINGTMVLGSNNGAADGIMTSVDGSTWSRVTSPYPCGSLDGIESDGDVLLFLAGNNYWVTSDLVTYTALTMTYSGSALWSAPRWNGAVFSALSLGTEDRSITIVRQLLTIATELLSDVVSTECLQSGLLTAGDIDVTALSQSVRGYRIGSIGAIRSAIEPLQAAWPFDVRQHGYKIQFVARGGSSVVTIPASDLDARGSGDAPGVQITTSREMDSQLPRRVTVQHLDSDREYNTGSQYAERLNTAAINAQLLDLPIVLTSNEAAGKAEVLLYLYWLERHDVSIVLPPTYSQLEPGDVVTLVTPEGNVTLRLVAVTNDSDGRVECRAKYANAAIYTPAALGAAPAVTGTTTISPSSASVYVLLDIPAVHSLLETPGYLAAMYGRRSGWPGGVLMRSEDSGSSWSDVQAFIAPGATVGRAVDSLGVVESRLIDKSSRLTVSLAHGSLYSITELQMLSGGNCFAYGAHGRWEIIAAQTCTLLGDATYVLTDLLRGRYGTEWAMGLPASDDTIVLLDTDDLAVIGMSSAQIGLSLLYRGITDLQDISSDTDYAFAYSGVNLECFSPVYFRGYRDPATGDWSCDWIRRTRSGGEWRDRVDASLGETAEAYEVDFFSDGTYTTVKRTLAVATAACVYTAAQQVTDFGFSQSRIYAKVYQMSSIAGRGYPLAGSSAIGPVGSTFTELANITYLDRLPPALQTLDETFPADTGFSKYTESSGGTTSVASNKYTITHVGAKNDIVVKNTISFSAPVAWVEATIAVTNTGATGHDSGGVGIVKDANNLIFSSMDRLNSIVRVQIKIGGVSYFLGSIVQTWGTSFKLALSLVANSACVWIDTGSGWTYKLGADVSGYYDFRTTGNLTGWNPGFILANGGGNSTWDFSAFKAGSFGGVGMRDQTLVTDEYAAPYFPAADSILFSATIADPRGTAYCGVFTFNLTTYALAQVSAILVSRGGKTYNDLSAHIIRYAGGNRRMLISTWGNGFGGSIQTLHELFTTGDVLSGVNVVTMTAITLPGQTGASPGAYDAMMAWDGSQWLIAYTLTDDTSFSGNPFYPALATSAAMSSFSLVAKDSTTGRGYEGTKLINDSGVFYVLAGGPAGTGNASRAYDSAMSFIGSLDATFAGGADTQPHPMMFAHGGGRKILTFDNSRFGGGGFTWGHLRLMGAT